MLAYRFHAAKNFQHTCVDSPVMSVSAIRAHIIHVSNMTLDPREVYLELREAESGRVFEDDNEVLPVTTPLVVRRRPRLAPTQGSLDVAEAARAPPQFGRSTR